AVLLTGVKRSFRGRQRENKPAVTGVYRLKFEDIAKEGAVAFRFLAVNDDVRSVNHRSLILISRNGGDLTSYRNCRAITSLSVAIDHRTRKVLDRRPNGTAV